MRSDTALQILQDLECGANSLHEAYELAEQASLLVWIRVIRGCDLPGCDLRNLKYFWQMGEARELSERSLGEQVNKLDQSLNFFATKKP